MVKRLALWAALAMPVMLMTSGVLAADLPSIGAPQPATDKAPDAEGYFFTLQPLGADLGKVLASYGIYLTGRTINEGINSASGGLQRGSFYEGYTQVGVNLDMNRLFGLPEGGALHFMTGYLQGDPYFNYSGSAFAYNRVWVYHDGVRLQELSYEQKLFDDQVDVKVGRIPVFDEFDGDAIHCQFILALCSAPPGYTFDKGSPAYVTSSYAAVVKVSLPASFYFNFGAYADEPILTTAGHYNWTGEDWDVNQLTGVTVPFQLGYRTTFANDEYPRSYSIGGFIDTGTYTDALLNKAGQDLFLNHGAPMIDSGRSGIWLQAQQMVWRPDRQSERGLTLFGGANFLTSGRPNIENDVFGGILWRGLFASRPNDTIGFEAMLITLNSPYVQAMDDRFALLGSTRRFDKSEEAFEIHYGIAVAPGMTVKPFAQYVANPDQFGIKNVQPNLTRSIFVGVAFTSGFPETFGLPQLRLSGN